MSNIKKLFFTFFVISCSYGLYWYLSKPPEFQGPDRFIKKNIWEFNHAKTDRERARVALFENPLTDYDRILKNSKNFSESELQTLENMSQFKSDLTQKLENFFDSISFEDVQRITHDNPLSLHLIAKKFSSLPDNDSECSESDVVGLSNKWGEELTRKKGTLFLFYFLGRDISLFEKYNKTIVQILNTDSRFSEYKDLLDNYFSFSNYESKYLKEAFAGFGDIRTDSMIVESKQNKLKDMVLKTGYSSEAMLDKDLYDLAIQFPGCFRNPSAFLQSQEILKTKEK